MAKRQGGNGWVPIPDPTALTTAAVAEVTRQYQQDIKHLRSLLDGEINALSRLLDERYATQTKALDAAFVAAEKAVATALTSAEKAVATAERANEKRFESVNEFRKTLTDQAATFMGRQEYVTAHKALEDKITAGIDRIAALELRLTSRLDLAAGLDSGVNAQRLEGRAERGATNQTVIMVIMAISVLIAIGSLLFAVAH